MIDKNGKLFGKISILDIAVVLVFLAMAAGFVLRGGTATIEQIIGANQEFQVVLAIENVRIYSVNAVNVGDRVFEQHAGELGEVIEFWHEPATDMVRRDDATVVVMESEYRYNLFIRLRSQGFISETSGFYIGGNNHVVPGQTIRMQSSNMISVMTVYEVTEG